MHFRSVRVDDGCSSFGCSSLSSGSLRCRRGRSLRSGCLGGAPSSAVLATGSLGSARKMLKRQMYGRAGFNLLRKRILLSD
ncbi:hypothetical protein BDB13_6480 [Rhodococcus sp. OK302]|nr:hypothetical protein BDB13_6480 [Rhodococcus sp. OK302]